MDSQVHRTRDSPMVCPGRRFSGSARFPPPRCFHVASIFQRLFLGGFDRELEIAWIFRCTEPAIRLWFTLADGFLDRPVFQNGRRLK